MKTRATHVPAPLRSRLRITQLGWAVIVITVCIIVGGIAFYLLATSQPIPGVG
jgi:hypothetical protein